MHVKSDHYQMQRCLVSHSLIEFVSVQWYFNISFSPFCNIFIIDFFYGKTWHDADLDFRWISLTSVLEKTFIFCFQTFLITGKRWFTKGAWQSETWVWPLTVRTWRDAVRAWHAVTREGRVTSRTEQQKRHYTSSSRSRGKWLWYAPDASSVMWARVNACWSVRF